MATIAGRKVGEVGYGLMGFTWRPSQTTGDKAFEVMKTALAQGSNFWNGGEFYGPPESNSLHLLNEYFTKYPEDADKVIISIKGGADPKTIMPTGDEAGVRRSVDQCLKILDGKKKLDVFECARVDPKVPIEISIRTLAEYIKEGKLGGISLSECSADSIRRAAKVHKISAVEVEFSMFALEILENGVAKACADLDIPVVAYSPIGRGFFSKDIRKPSDLEGDIRSHFPRFQPGNFEQNMILVEKVEKVADRKGVTPSQIALAWVREKSKEPGMPTIIPIPGTVSSGRVKENTQDISLTKEEMKELDDIVNSCEIVGGRYPEAASHVLYGDSPPLNE